MLDSVVFSSTIPNLTSDDMFSRMSAFNRWASRWCSENNVGFVDNWSQTIVIKTQQSVLARLGENAHLSCHLSWFSSSVLESKIIQVTWQKTLSDEQKNVATYNQIFGQTVNDDFKNKVQFKEAGLQNNSIVIRNVAEQDGGCYVCVFNMFPDGSLSNKTCLHVYELHEPVLQVRRSKSPEESLVSCSATGRPAPTVTLTVPQQHLHLSQHNTITVTNTNNTVTVTTTAVLSGLHDDSTRVGCAARVDSGP
ncbi:OX-2 membrane glycoprotein-like [Nematolebias whitei]|uniref:OX-2 membrane glycoprotein-like n=1 Tax=Nematolebias whitei TaxID=451745 RepID=UPI00189C0670|nr:OX-2 membrane glycoprotein-like [Nematolebias whitei]